MTKNLLAEVDATLSEVIECGGMITPSLLNKLWHLHEQVKEEMTCCQTGESKRIA